MPTLSMNELTTFRWSFEEDTGHYAAAGIPAIGVWRQKLSDCGLARASELLAHYDLRVSHLMWAGGFTGADGRSFRECLDDAAEALRTAAALKAPCLVIHSGPRAGHTINHARRLIQTALKELAPLSSDLSVDLAIEPMHAACGAPWTFINSLDDARSMLAAIGSPHVKLVLDTYHLGQFPRGSDNGLLAAIPELVPHIAIVQLGDSRDPPGEEPNRCRLGEGNIPLDEIVAALQAARYDGFYDVELMGEDVEATCYVQLIEHARAAFEALLAQADIAAARSPAAGE